jgi:tryptophanyl-tRNA synthetase
MANNKPRVFSAVQPTGKLHIGNYIGALSLWAKEQYSFDGLFCVVDLHALTIPESINPTILNEKTWETVAIYLASGIDSNKSNIFIQSTVHEHAELSWLLTCVTPLGWLERMTQFKSKSSARESVGTGLLCYPTLMAADILLYDAKYVPVGEDQRQHIEITRDIALRFNNMFGPGRVAQPFGFCPHRSGQAAFPHPALPEGNPRSCD